MWKYQSQAFSRYEWLQVCTIRHTLGATSLFVVLGQVLSTLLIWGFPIVLSFQPYCPVKSYQITFCKREIYETSFHCIIEVCLSIRFRKCHSTNFECSRFQWKFRSADVSLRKEGEGACMTNSLQGHVFLCTYNKRHTSRFDIKHTLIE